MRSVAPRVVAWLGRMSQAQPETAADGADTLPASLLPVWRLLSDDYVPILCAQISAFQSWLEAHPALEIPRTFGTHRVVFGRAAGAPCEGSRALFSYDQWMLQRALAAYLNAPANARDAISQFATTIKAAPLLALNLTQRVKREQFRLCRA